MNLSSQQIDVLKQRKEAVYDAVSYFGKTDPPGSRKHSLIAGLMTESLNRLYSNIENQPNTEVARVDIISILASILRNTRAASSDELQTNVEQPLLSVANDLGIMAEVETAVSMRPYTPPRRDELWSNQLRQRGLVSEQEWNADFPSSTPSVPSQPTSPSSSAPVDMDALFKRLGIEMPRKEEKPPAQGESISEHERQSPPPVPEKKKNIIPNPFKKSGDRTPG